MILVTRPKESAAHTQRAFERRGFQVFCEPLLTISFLAPFVHIIENAHYITTSAHGIRALASLVQERHAPVWCVGEQSKAMAHSFGFRQVFCPEGNENATGLLQAIDSQVSKNCPLIYVHGRKISLDLKGCLIEKGYGVTAYEVYEAIPLEQFSQKCLQLFFDNRIQAVTLYSEETAGVFRQLVKAHFLENFMSSCVALCLSEKIKNSLDPNWKMAFFVSPSTEKLAHTAQNLLF